MKSEVNPRQPTDENPVVVGEGGLGAAAQLSFAEQWERAGLDEALANPSNLRPSYEEMSMWITFSFVLHWYCDQLNF